MYQNTKTLASAQPTHAVAGALLDSSLIPQTNKELYNIKLFNCNNYIQIYIYDSPQMKKNKNIEDYSVDNKKVDSSKSIKNNETEYKSIRNDNALRSKLCLERLVKCNEDDFRSFITLTFSENIVSIQKANKMFNIWRTRIKKEFSDFKYVCVPEYQKRGAVHYHLITNLEVGSKYLPLQEGKETQYDVVYWNQGFTSSFPIEDASVVSYMSKYMTKNIDVRLYGRKRYFYSKNLIMPKQEFLNLNNEKVKIHLTKLLENKNMNYKSSYLNQYTKEKINFIEFKKIA